MIIQDKLIFIMIPRTGTYSVEQALLDSNIKYYGHKQNSVDKVYNPENRLQNGLSDYSHTHISFPYMYNSFGPSYKYFTVLRNPTERLISIINKVQHTLQFLSKEIPILSIEEYIKALSETGYYRNTFSPDNKKPLQDFFSKLNIPNHIIETELDLLRRLTPLHPQVYYTHNNDKRIKYFQLEKLYELEKYLNFELATEKEIKLTKKNQLKSKIEIKDYNFVEDFVKSEYEIHITKPLL